MRREYVGGAQAARLTAPLGGTLSDLTISCDNLTNWPTGAGARPFYIVIDRNTASEEKILCSSRSGNTLIVYAQDGGNGRGADGTSVTSHANNAVVEHVFTATDADEANAFANVMQAKGDLLTRSSSTAVRVPVGSDGFRLEAASSNASGLTWAGDPVTIGMAVSGEVSAVTTGTAKVTFRMPFAMTVEQVRASLTTASSSGNPTFDINKAGTSILGANKLSIDSGETTSVTAATPTTITTPLLEDNSVITVDVDTAGSGATGAKVYLIGARA